MLSFLLAAALGAAGPARADSKSILDIDQCLDNARRKCSESCQQLGGPTISACLSNCSLKSDTDPTQKEVRTNCVETSADERETARLCAMTKNRDFDDIVRQSSFRTNLAGQSIRDECAKRDADATAKKKEEEDRRAIEKTAAFVQEKLGGLLKVSAHNQAVGDVEAKQFESLTQVSRQKLQTLANEPCEQDPDAADACARNPNFEAADRTYQAFAWGLGTVKRYDATLGDIHNELLAVAGCVNGLRLDAQEGKDPDLANAPDVIDRLDALYLRAAILGDQTRSTVSQLNDMLQKWNLAPDADKVENRAGDLPTDPARTVPIRKGDPEYEKTCAPAIRDNLQPR